MLNRIEQPYKAVSNKRLVLLDTNIVYKICNPDDRHKKKIGTEAYQNRIADAVMSGRLRNGVVTDAVVYEMYNISRRSRKEAYLVRNLESIVNDERVLLGHITVDHRRDNKTSEMYDYLKSNIKKPGEGRWYLDEGEVSLLLASYDAGIPFVVTDDNFVFKDTVKNYMKNRFKRKFGSVSEFTVMDSKDFCSLMDMLS